MEENDIPQVFLDAFNKGVDFTDGAWIAVTMGEFLALLVDAGDDPAILFRVVADLDRGEDGSFIRVMEVMMLPDGWVRAAIEEIEIATGKPVGIHKVLAEMLRRGVIK